MSEVKHTPGPWRAVHDVGEWSILGPSGGYMGGLMVGSDRCRANARLVAAAPDLLLALRELLADITDYQTINNLGGHDNHSQRLARAALAKAEGRS